MLKWLAEALIGWPWCWHRWAVKERLERKEKRHWPRESEWLTQSVTFVLRCEKCGDIKSRVVG